MSTHIPSEAPSIAIEVETNDRGVITNMNAILAGFADDIHVNTVIGPDRPLVREQIANTLKALKATIDETPYDHPSYARWTKSYRVGQQHLEYGYGWNFWFLPRI